MRPAAVALAFCALCASPATAADAVPDPADWLQTTRQHAGQLNPDTAAILAPALDEADRILEVLAAAFAPTPATWARGHALGGNLADYAGNPGHAPGEFESFIVAARRILAATPPAGHSPAATSRWLDAAADRILTAVHTAERAGTPSRLPHSARPAALATVSADLRIAAQLARFHARRAAAAVHYNLFKRGLKLAELVAATYAEKDALAAWRDLVALAESSAAGSTPPALARDPRLLAHWRSELKRVAASYKDLEEQCCPPDEAVMRAPVWSPATDGNLSPPYLALPARRPGARTHR